jgi:tetratricopeptide (TPR) repeat protein
MGAYEKAEPLYLKALKIREKVLGEEHPDTATSYNNLAVFYYGQGDFERAYEFMKKAVDVRSKVLPSNHPHLISSKKGLKIIEGRV